MFKSFLLVCTSATLSAQPDFQILWQDDNKVAIINTQTQERVSQQTYDAAEEFCGWMGMLRKGNLYGLYDLDRGKIYCCEYDKIEGFDDVGYPGMKGFVYQKGKMGLVGIRNEDGTFEQMLPCEYDKIDAHNDYPHAYTIQKGGLYGVYNSEVGRIVVPCTFKKGFSYDVHEKALVVYDKKSAAIYNMDGKVLLPLQKQELDYLDASGRYYQVNIGKKMGLFDIENERWRVEPIEGFVYDAPLLERYYPVWDKDGQDVTLVDGETGKPLLPAEYRMQTSATEDRYVLIQTNGKWGAYDLQTQKIVVECTYDKEEDVIGQWR